MEWNEKVYEFGDFRFELSQGLLSRRGEAIPIQPKVAALLGIFLERPGDVVRKEELFQILWPDTVVSDGSLTQTVFQLRQALGVTPSGRRYVVTAPGLGYRFVAPVSQIRKTLETPAIAEPFRNPESPVASNGAGPHSVRKRRCPFALLFLLPALVLGALWLRSPRSPSTNSGSNARRAAVAVLGFRQLTGGASYHWLSEALSEMFRAELGVGGHLRPISREAVQQLRHGLTLTCSSASPITLRRIHRATSTDFVVTGSFAVIVQNSRETLRVDLFVQDAVHGETLCSHSKIAPLDEVFELVSSLGSRIRSTLQRPQEREPPSPSIQRGSTASRSRGPLAGRPRRTAGKVRWKRSANSHRSDPRSSH